MAEKKKKKETFGQAFKRNRKKFMDSGKANDYTFKYEGKDYNVRQKGETEKGLLAKYVKSAPKKSVRPKTRPSAGISANTKKKIEETVRKVANTDSKAKPSRPRTEKTEQQKRNEAAAAKRRGVGAGSFAGKGAGKDKPKAKPTRKADGVPARLREKTTDGLPKGIGGMTNRIDEPGAPFLGSKGGKSAALRRKDVKEGQAKYRDRGAPTQLTLSQRHLRMFKNDPSSLTKVQKDRLFKTLNRKGVAIPKGLSGNNR